MRDVLVFAMIVLGFATLVTAHVALSFALMLFHPPRWRGALALVVPVLAPVWGWREGLRWRVLVWGVAAAVYVAGSIASRAG